MKFRSGEASEMFSIIVPVYNAVDYIERCINSVLSQDFQGFELIIVNDGSSDGSVDLIRKRYGSIKNIVIVDQKNSGVSCARNVGIGLSKGRYLIFLDSDDWIENGYLGYLRSVFERSNVDGIVLGYFLSDGIVKTKFKFHKPNGCISSDEYCRMFLDGGISNHPWDKVFKRSIYVDNGIRFPENISIGEDAVVSAKLGFFSENICLSPRAFLNYMQNTGGVTKSSFTMERMISLDKALSLILEQYKGRFDQKNLSKFYLIKFLNQLTFKSFSLFKLSGLPYQNYRRHVDSLNVFDFKSRRDFMMALPIWFFSVCNVPALSKYYIKLIHKSSKFMKASLRKMGRSGGNEKD